MLIVTLTLRRQNSQPCCCRRCPCISLSRDMHNVDGSSLLYPALDVNLPAHPARSLSLPNRPPVYTSQRDLTPHRHCYHTSAESYIVYRVPSSPSPPCVSAPSRSSRPTSEDTRAHRPSHDIE